MRRTIRTPAILAAATVTIATGASHAGPGRTAADAAIDDARRAAATRLLDASRFRQRQEVVLADGIRAAQAELTDECVDRAVAGRPIGDCTATGRPGAAQRARLAARRTDMLDQIMSASETVYARQFTAAEMDEITRFFRSPVGQKYAARYPGIIDQVGVARRPILRRYLIGTATTSLPRP